MIPGCKEIRKNILRVSQASGHGHVPTCFSIVELLYAVYETIRHDPANPAWEGRDISILSKGHASLGLYCVLAHFGYFEVGRVYSFGSFMSDFGCHPDRLKVPGVEVSTGSLGHGIAVGVGMALAAKLKNNGRRVVVLIGDGESNEGTVWESLMVAANLKLDNLSILFDNNRSQERCLPVENPAARFRAFGCEVAEVNGHEVDAIKTALIQKSPGVKVIVANTIKGYGCKTFVENTFAWHRRSPTPDEFHALMEELDAQTV